jgi:hypothetical protein
MTPAEFVQMCKELRAMGAVKVVAEGIEAVFVPQVQAQTVASPEKKSRKPAKSPEDLREEEYARELGRVR